MFDFLKKKISGFIDGITKKEEEKGEPEKKAGETPAPGIERLPPQAAEVPKKKEAKPAPKPKEAPKKAEPPKPAKKTEPKTKQEPVKAPEPPKTPEPKTPEPAKRPEPAARKEPEAQSTKQAPAPQAIPAPITKKEAVPAHTAPKRAPPVKLAPKLKQAEEKPPGMKKPEPIAPKPKTIEVPTPEAKEPEPEEAEPEIKEPEPEESELEEPASAEPESEPSEPEPAHSEPETAPEPELPPEPPAREEKPKERIKLGIFDTVKSFVTREVEISEKDVKEMVESLELELLEADVDIGVAEGIKEELMGKLVGSKVAKAELHRFISGSIKETLIDILTNEKDFDIVSRVSAGEKPVKIMFIGINGAGKTTTIAKVAKLLMDNNRKVVFAAADTFRAAAIEQMAVHAGRLNVKMIAREYGSDPTSVAYDAVNYARAHGADAVLIDTAGRQDTNISLLNEMKKMKRVISPDICIYIGESIAGNAILEQVSAFNREVGVDAVILSKLDCDPKGGTMLSISKATGVPIIYVGVGQAYDALERFDPKAIVSRIVE